MEEEEGWQPYGKKKKAEKKAVKDNEETKGKNYPLFTLRTSKQIDQLKKMKRGIEMRRYHTKSIERNSWEWIEWAKRKKEGSRHSIDGAIGEVVESSLLLYHYGDWSGLEREFVMRTMRIKNEMERYKRDVVEGTNHFFLRSFHSSNSTLYLWLRSTNEKKKNGLPHGKMNQVEGHSIYWTEMEMIIRNDTSRILDTISHPSFSFLQRSWQQIQKKKEMWSFLVDKWAPKGCNGGMELSPIQNEMRSDLHFESETKVERGIGMNWREKSEVIEKGKHFMSERDKESGRIWVG